MAESWLRDAKAAMGTWLNAGMGGLEELSGMGGKLVPRTACPGSEVVPLGLMVFEDDFGAGLV